MWRPFIIVLWDTRLTMRVSCRVVWILPLERLAARIGRRESVPAAPAFTEATQGAYCLSRKTVATFFLSSGESSSGPSFTVSLSSLPVKRNGTW
jgi:hypothetical protein